MLTIEQCRGARGLLGWTQQDLADASGLSKTAINNFEKGHSDIKADSLRAIREAFEGSEIEFQEDTGLRKRSEQTRMIKGRQALSVLLDDIRSTMHNQKGDILVMNADTSLASKITSQKLFDHIQFLKQNEIRQRVLCTRNTKNVLSPDDECRWLDAASPDQAPLMFIYGTKVAIQLWEESMIIMVDSLQAVEAETNRFENLWAEAEPADAHYHNGLAQQKSA